MFLDIVFGQIPLQVSSIKNRGNGTFWVEKNALKIKKN